MDWGVGGPTLRVGRFDQDQRADRRLRLPSGDVKHNRPHETPSAPAGLERRPKADDAI